MVSTRNVRAFYQYLIGTGVISILGIIAYISTDITGYRVVALILLLAVSVLAMLFDIFPVLFTAVISALSWNFFFIPPTLTFHIGTPEDALMFLMYFVIALINAVLSFKIRDAEKKEREKEEREKTIHLYNTLLNSLSHELRTPIATIIGSVDTIRESGNRISAANLQELYQEIETAGFRLNRQVENLLNMSRLESGFFQPRPDWCDVNELVHTVIDMNRADAGRHAIVFETDDTLPLFKLDRVLIEQVLHNLVHNALQHTPETSAVTLMVAQDHDACLFTVSDNGPGFPASALEWVFNKFHRLPGAARGGTGLGLSIAKGFTEAHHGTIFLENLPGGGARFTVRIPGERSDPQLLNHE